MAEPFSKEFWLDIPKREKHFIFIDRLEIAFKDKFGIDTFDYAQKLIAQGFTSDEVYSDVQIQMDIIYNDLRIANNQFGTLIDCTDNPFTSQQGGYSSRNGSPSVRSAAG